MRDHATLEQLVVLTNLESINSVLIRQTLPQPERLQKLNEIAITQMKSLLINSVHPKFSLYLFQRREKKYAEFTQRNSAITPYLLFSALKK